MIRRGPIAAALALALAALTVTACGADDNGGKTAPAAQKTGAMTTIALASAGNLGDILVDSQGRTLYLFEQDAGTTSACSGDCAIDWPPVTTTGKPTVAGGLSAAKVGTTSRSPSATSACLTRRWTGASRPRGPHSAAGSSSLATTTSATR